MEPNKLQELLEKLGLTEYESKTLTTLFKLKEAKAPDISTESQVPKTRVYDVLTRLVEKELVIEMQGRPKKYRVMEPEKVFQKLVTNKKNELAILEKQTKKTLNSLNTGILETEEEKVLKVKETQDFIKVLSQELKTANKSIHVFSNTILQNPEINKILENAKKQKIEVKALTSKETNKTYLFPKKIAAHGIEAFIIDNQKLIMALSDLKKNKNEYHFTIWQNTPLLPALREHFDRLWQK